MRLAIFSSILYCYYVLVAAEFHFNPVAENTPLIINKLGTAHLTYDSFQLVFFADLKPFYALKQNIKTAVATIKNLTTVLNKPTYTTAAGQLEHQLHLLYLDEEKLESQRTKRWVLCEWCGKINHHITGVMDAATAREYDKVINGIKNATLKNQELIRNQSEIFQVAHRFNKNTFVRFENKINEFGKLANNQTDKIKQIELEVYEKASNKINKNV